MPHRIMTFSQRRIFTVNSVILLATITIVSLLFFWSIPDSERVISKVTSTSGKDDKAPQKSHAEVYNQRDWEHQMKEKEYYAKERDYVVKSLEANNKEIEEKRKRGRKTYIEEDKEIEEKRKRGRQTYIEEDEEIAQDDRELSSTDQDVEFKIKTIEEDDDESDEERPKRTKKDEKYLVYLCDKSVRCSGFADRQRAIVGLYFLALATNRKFGVVMTEPTMLTDFYRPNEVKWDLKASELAGKSSIDLRCMANRNDCKFDDINAAYPSDVIYVRSKSDFRQILGGNSRYRESLPEWVFQNRNVMFGRGWMTLMRPTDILRQGVNSILVEIARDMQRDKDLMTKIQTDSCQAACNEVLVYAKTHSRFIDECLKRLSSYHEVMEGQGVLLLQTSCSVKALIEPPPMETIEAATGYDYVEMELVCAQIRIGKGSTIPNEPAFSDKKDVFRIWDHLQPYVTRGHHVYLATDALEIRDEAKKIFGPRVYFISDPIVHVNKVQEGQDGWEGMKSSLTEQLLLATNCKVLIYTSSGFGTKAAMMRHVLTRGKKGFETFVFSGGKVTPSQLNKKSMALPKPSRKD